MWRLLHIRRPEDPNGDAREPSSWPPTAAAASAPAGDAAVPWDSIPTTRHPPHRSTTGATRLMTAKPTPVVDEQAMAEREAAFSRPETIVGKSLCDLSEPALQEGAACRVTVAAGSTPPILSFIRGPGFRKPEEQQAMSAR